MSSLLKPNTRSLSTFRPQSLFPSVALSFPPTHTFCLGLCLFPTHRHTHTHTHTQTHTHLELLYFSLSVIYPPQRSINMYMYAFSMCTQAYGEHSLEIFKLLPPPHIFSCPFSRNKELHSSQLAFSNPVVSLNAKLTEESVHAHSTKTSIETYTWQLSYSGHPATSPYSWRTGSTFLWDLKNQQGSLKGRSPSEDGSKCQFEWWRRVWASEALTHLLTEKLRIT